MTGILFFFNSTIIFDLSGIPGLFTTSSAFRIIRCVCFPSSYAIPLCERTFLYLSFIFASTAVPAPLSPAPRTTKSPPPPSRREGARFTFGLVIIHSNLFSLLLTSPLRGDREGLCHLPQFQRNNC